jgi:hypothetical protein
VTPLATLLLAAACADEPALAPVEPRAAWVLEATRIRVGDVAALERRVVTPPGWAVAPLEPGAPAPGFWLLETEALPPERLAARWIHRTRLRIRAREAGRFEWPGAEAVATAPDGAPRRLALAPLPLEVVSVLPEAPDRLTPFGVRALPATAPSAGSLALAAVAGAVAAGVALVIFLLALRRRRALAAAPPAPAPAEPPMAAAHAALAQARDALAADPRRAADAASHALRRYLKQRYAVPAPARTSEELFDLPAPFALSTRWAGLVSLLRALDAERFAPPHADAAERVARLVERAAAFVAGDLPPAP